MTVMKRPLLFNSPLETGVRSVVILNACFPRAFDLHRLIALDHLVVHAADVGGPFSLHPATPRRATEMIVRRSIVERGLLLMESRKLVDRMFSKSGVTFMAGDIAATFVGWLSSDYANALKKSCEFISGLIAEKSESEFDELIEAHFEKWALEFQAIEQISPS